jgi:chemotaxis protein methyltransferase CheR
MNEIALNDLEFDLLLDAIQRRHGYDFRHYSQASLRRRVDTLRTKLGAAHVAELIPRLLRDDAAFDAFLREMSITVTEMFRDPDFYVALRRHVIPRLETYPLLKVWHAGCATGEEVYSMAIVLHEEGLLNRTQIYATDFNNESLDTARNAIYPLDKIRGFLSNYNATEPKGVFSDYYLANDRAAIMLDALQRQITFANHNLVTDGVFGEMNIILCRNVLIYFDKTLQDRVLGLFRDSLIPGGYLCLGPKESLQFARVAQDFEAVADRMRIFRRRLTPAIPGGARPL